MIPRRAEAAVRRLSKGYPVVVITGPRQSGKTTLAREDFKTKPYVSLENIHERDFALSDPQGFLARFPSGAVIDEAQNAPALFSYLQTIVDNKKKPGLFILTGSQNFNLLASITQTLAGRAGILHLLPFTVGELRKAILLPQDLNELLYQGFYPALYDRDVTPQDWYANYIITYLERDIRQIANVHDLTVFQRFLKLCASRTGQLLNMANLALESGVSQGTTRAWLSVLETSYIVHLLSPHHRNFGKRVVKTPKLYFYDTGLACNLMGIENPQQLATHPHRAALFETFVVSELLKQRFNKGLRSNLYFWRDNIGTEIDVVVEEGHTLLPIEIKSGQTINADFLAPLQKWLKYAGRQAGQSSVIYGGDETYIRSGTEFRSWKDVD